MHEIPELDDPGLRRFGLVTGALLVVLFGLLLPLLFGYSLPWWPWLLALALAAPAIVAPRSLNPVYRGWMRFGLFMSRIMTPLIMGIIFYLMFLPIGLVMRLFGRDSMRRRRDPALPSYRNVNEPGVVNDMEKPY